MITVQDLSNSMEPLQIFALFAPQRGCSGRVLVPSQKPRVQGGGKGAEVETRGCVLVPGDWLHPFLLGSSINNKALTWENKLFDPPPPCQGQDLHLDDLP